MSYIRMIFITLEAPMRRLTLVLVLLGVVAGMAGAVEGDTLWTRTYGRGGNHCEKANAIIPSGDGNFILAGYASEESNFEHKDVCLMKVTPQGDILWTRSYGGLRNEYATDIISAGDGGFVLAGSAVIRDATGSYIDVFLALKVDALGNALWWHTYDYGIWNACLAKSIARTDDGGFLIVGYLDFEGMGEWYDAMLVRIDSQGNLLQQTVLGYPGGNYFDEIIPSSDGNFLVAGGHV